MRTFLAPTLRALLVLTVLTGIGYPALITGLAQLAFPGPANGSLVVVGGRTLGSRLVGQPFHQARYFWNRPSATAPEYNGAASAASELGPTSPALDSAVRARVAALRASGAVGPIPVDLVTASGSGLDPDISPRSAHLQIGRVARVRGLDSSRVDQLVSGHVQGQVWGLLGEPRVNVLELNLALDRLSR